MTIEGDVRSIIKALGCDPDSDGMRDTPRRVEKMWRELTAGYQMDPVAILNKAFDPGNYDSMIVLSGCTFYSTCEHHMLPFTGTAAVGYIPRAGRIVGISKLARLVDCFARRFQIQERMTQQIADAVQECLDPLGVGVFIQATHLCMVCRGVMKPGTMMTTSVMLGTMREDVACRDEFLRSIER